MRAGVGFFLLGGGAPFGEIQCGTFQGNIGRQSPFFGGGGGGRSEPPPTQRKLETDLRKPWCKAFI